MTAVALPKLASTGKLTQLRVIRSEWTKLRTVRSTIWSLLVAVVLTLGLPMLIGAIISSHWSQQSAHDRLTFNPLDPMLVGVFIAMLPIGVLGVLAITAEYSTGMIRSSLTAVPKRLPVLWAKAIVFALVTFALMLPSVLIAFFVTQSIFTKHDASFSFHHPGVARVVLGAPLVLAVLAVITLGIGTMIRNTAGGIATFAAVFFVVPPLLHVLPSSWNNAISPYLPSNAGGSILELTKNSGDLRPWPGFALFCGYALLSLALGAIVLKRRDA